MPAAPPEPDEQTVKWQDRFDREFPRGVVAASWLDPFRVGHARPDVTYQVPRVIVLRVEDGRPVVMLPVFAGSDKVLGPLRVLSCEQLRSAPRQLKVTSETGIQIWTTVLSERLARLMAPERKLFFDLAPHGGRAFQHHPLEP